MASIVGVEVYSIDLDVLLDGHNESSSRLEAKDSVQDAMCLWRFDRCGLDVHARCISEGDLISSVDPACCILVLHIRQARNAKHRLPDVSRSASQPPSPSELLMQLSQNMTPRGLEIAFASSTLLPEHSEQEILGKYKLISHGSSDVAPGFVHDVYVWNGRQADGLVKASVMVKAFQLENMLQTNMDGLLRIVISDGDKYCINENMFPSEYSGNILLARNLNMPKKRLRPVNSDVRAEAKKMSSAPIVDAVPSPLRKKHNVAVHGPPGANSVEEPSTPRSRPKISFPAKSQALFPPSSCESPKIVPGSTLKSYFKKLSPLAQSAPMSLSPKKLSSAPGDVPPLARHENSLQSSTSMHSSQGDVSAGGSPRSQLLRMATTLSITFSPKGSPGSSEQSPDRSATTHKQGFDDRNTPPRSGVTLEDTHTDIKYSEDGRPLGMNRTFSLPCRWQSSLQHRRDFMLSSAVVEGIAKLRAMDDGTLDSRRDAGVDAFNKFDQKMKQSFNGPVADALTGRESGGDAFDSSEHDQRRHKLKVFSSVLSLVYDDFLFVSSDEVARDLAKLRGSGITHVVNAAATVCDNYHEQDGIKYLAMHLYDRPQQDIFPVFFEVLDFIETARSSDPAAKVLIHCHQGVSRSCALAISYIMYHEHMDYETAFQVVKNGRGVCSPNAGFIYQLINWHRMLNPSARTSESWSYAALFRMAPLSPEDLVWQVPRPVRIEGCSLKLDPRTSYVAIVVQSSPTTQAKTIAFHGPDDSSSLRGKAADRFISLLEKYWEPRILSLEAVHGLEFSSGVYTQLEPELCSILKDMIVIMSKGDNKGTPDVQCVSVPEYDTEYAFQGTESTAVAGEVVDVLPSPKTVSPVKRNADRLLFAFKGTIPVTIGSSSRENWELLSVPDLDDLDDSSMFMLVDGHSRVTFMWVGSDFENEAFGEYYDEELVVSIAEKTACWLSEEYKSVTLYGDPSDFSVSVVYSDEEPEDFLNAFPE